MMSTKKISPTIKHRHQKIPTNKEQKRTNNDPNKQTNRPTTYAKAAAQRFGREVLEIAARAAADVDPDLRMDVSRGNEKKTKTKNKNDEEIA
jgi:hypothetical protein